MLALGTQSPNFELPDTDGTIVKRTDFAGRPLLVLFICNHCPFVIHIREELAKIGRDYQSTALGVVAINSNDAAKYPDDSPAKMKIERLNAGYFFPYLFDETQSVAKEFHAACTPDIYLFDKNHKLVYRGQLDESRPSNGVPVTGKDLRLAIDDCLAGRPLAFEQKPSLGCNIKWKE